MMRLNTKACLEELWRGAREIRIATMSNSALNELLIKYEPPAWAQTIRNKPRFRIKLAHRDTPIHRWDIPNVPAPFHLSIKRDDMTGSTLSGNKVRKLEFVLADAVSLGCDSVLTCGGIQSNHCRTTAVAARQLGMEPYLFLRRFEKHKDIACPGNLLLNQLVKSNIVLMPPPCVPWLEHVKPKMDQLMEKLRKEGRKPYFVPLGGSNHIGLFGYLEAFQELMDQGVLDNFDDIFLAVGSGGTSAGLAIANLLTGSKLRIHAVCVSDKPDYFYKELDQELEESGISAEARDIIDIVDGYKGKGYGYTTPEELSQLAEISATTGIILDPTYTMKAARGMLTEMKKNPQRFKGSRVLFIHTGGVFGTYDGRVDDTLNNQSSKQIKWWTEYNISSKL